MHTFENNTQPNIEQGTAFGDLTAAKLALLGAGLEPDGFYYDVRRTYSSGAAYGIVHCKTPDGLVAPVEVTFTEGVFSEFKILKN